MLVFTMLDQAGTPGPCSETPFGALMRADPTDRHVGVFEPCEGEPHSKRLHPLGSIAEYTVYAARAGGDFAEAFNKEVTWNMLVAVGDGTYRKLAA